MADSRQLSASLEDYLEAIFWIASEKGAARAKDIARRLNVKAGSVTGALQSLSRTNYINYAPYEVITLTAKGLEEARRIIRKHEVLKDFFIKVLGVTADVAEEGACRMEHAIGDQLLERLITFTDFIQACPRCGSDWVEQFHKTCNQSIPENFKQCNDCVTLCSEKLTTERLTMSQQISHMTLLDVAKGGKCIVRKIKQKAAVTKRLVEMGIGRGAVIEVERVAPLGDPIEIKVKGYHLSIRKEEAENIEVEA